MSHRDDCYSPDYARERGREDRRSGWDSPYAMGDCYEAQRAYDEGVAAERRHEQQRREMREQEEAAEMEYYQRQAEEEAAMAEAQEAEYYEAMERQRWEDEMANREPAHNPSPAGQMK